ncbi:MULTISPECIES: pyruvate dehydrogenase (acetyl-transferring) E1 component subunit alpha [Desulfococcus]|jgi:pyruvate dehydrogenase E1 component alpha subunit|uniref:Pyruvate dehydrogenase E1 component subunit alpha n=1 Tax=Desulfococcus multivorans DSM 2059 TaxID=1121405 RepID=S7U6H3_DESML|nr:pyruvate dehydrogenase (acetyl-transferring) E1 component subunit alpha [Desulfococcus multivorans]AOY59133.1 PdhA1: pyruvate dehydrogenase E1 component, subunit alpha [Desulfococcus multivorans]AQV01368.1 pyruvate dehydrogenase (acetyl-transferring) E1 component subunit alpha [Desulfococcus multivorans]EPR44942.1 pyruvate dehydrogenase (acetyl-transferring) E1 component, alpha subunit [Desulfococcus multivorans DSM 2059]MDX9817986.1 pyruvate dehydrogenase (acetyl-transferring) E1 component 
MKTQRMTKTKAESLDRDHALHLLGSMIRIRRMEEKCAELYTAMKIRGFMHLYDGEEAVAVGVMEALTQDDAVVATYREHGHALIRGLSAGCILAEMYGKQEGCSRGRGGSMHLFDDKTRFYGGNAIVGGGLPIAVGLALADKMRQKPRVTCCFFGDGAVAEGEFHESMNLASLWRLPLLFVCENNLYAMGTALKYTQAVMDLARKASSYDMPSSAVDGMDVLAVEAAAREAVQAVRSGDGPCFLECRTYRFRAHSMFDAELYRTKAEVEEWKKRCPIETFSRKLKREGLLTDADLEEMERDVAREIKEAVAFAEACTWEPLEDLTRFVYSERRTP